VPPAAQRKVVGRTQQPFQNPWKVFRLSSRVTKIPMASPRSSETHCHFDGTHFGHVSRRPQGRDGAKTSSCRGAPL